MSIKYYLKAKNQYNKDTTGDGLMKAGINIANHHFAEAVYDCYVIELEEKK